MSLYVILLNYVRPLAEIDHLLDAHRAFLARFYASGQLLLSGPKRPRTGGVILARGASREEIRGIVGLDPFFIAGVAEYEVIEFQPLMSAAAFDDLRSDSATPAASQG